MMTTSVAPFISNKALQIHLAHTQGFCAGVSVALDIVDRTLEKYGHPLYIRHDIVHNTYVINEYKKKGIIFTEDLNTIPKNATVILSAHGSSPAVFETAKKRQLHIIDATCPLVKKVHMEAKKLNRRAYQIIFIGHPGHQEFIGTKGHIAPHQCHPVVVESDVDQLSLDPNQPIGILTQTTLSVSDTKRIIKRIQQRYPKAQIPPEKDICYATQNRQDAIIDLTKTCDIILICGSPHSSNSNRLCELSRKKNTPSYMIDSLDDFNFDMIATATSVGISSGASVPHTCVNTLVTHIKVGYPNATQHQDTSVEESIWFPLPRELRE